MISLLTVSFLPNFAIPFQFAPSHQTTYYFHSDTRVSPFTQLDPPLLSFTLHELLFSESYSLLASLFNENMIAVIDD
jgi:hypothetical protein